MHQWSGWPGAYCLKCGTEDPLESAINCSQCKWSGGEYGMDTLEPCPEHARWMATHKTCPPSAGEPTRTEEAG